MMIPQLSSLPLMLAGVPGALPDARGGRAFAAELGAAPVSADLRVNDPGLPDPPPADPPPADPPPADPPPADPPLTDPAEAETALPEAALLSGVAVLAASTPAPDPETRTIRSAVPSEGSRSSGEPPATEPAPPPIGPPAQTAAERLFHHRAPSATPMQTGPGTADPAPVAAIWPPHAETRAPAAPDAGAENPAASGAARPLEAGQVPTAQRPLSPQARLPAAAPPAATPPPIAPVASPIAAIPDVLIGNGDGAAPPVADRVAGSAESALWLRVSGRTAPPAPPTTDPPAAFNVATDAEGAPGADVAPSPLSADVGQPPLPPLPPLPMVDAPRAAPASAPAPPPPLPAATVPSLVQSVLQTDTGTVELVLTPEDLGKLRFELTQSGDQMRIHLTVERPETLDLLRRHADQLLTEFRQAGYAGATLSFGQWGQGGQSENAQPPTHAPTEATPAPPGTAPEPATPAALPHTGGLDLRL